MEAKEAALKAKEAFARERSTVLKATLADAVQEHGIELAAVRTDAAARIQENYEDAQAIKRVNEEDAARRAYAAAHKLEELADAEAMEPEALVRATTSDFAESVHIEPKEARRVLDNPANLSATGERDASKALRAILAARHLPAAAEYECIVCYDDEFKEFEGLLCRPTAEGGAAAAAEEESHFVCDLCLGEKLLALQAADLVEKKKCGGRCYCPEGGPGGSCTSPYYSDTELAFHVRNTPGAHSFKAYLGVRRELLEINIRATTEREMERRFELEMARIEAMNETERKVYAARKRIVDEILTLRCPRCEAAFVDFANCFAIKCRSCDCHFCGWCFEDCGDRDDAHSHVAECPVKPTKAGTFYANGDATVSEQMFAAQNKRRQKRQLRAFFKEEVDADILEKVMIAVIVDLENLGLGKFIQREISTLDHGRRRKKKKRMKQGGGAVM